MNRHQGPIQLVVLGLWLLLPVARGTDRSADDFFETSIRPLLVAKCQSCHGGEKSEASLDLTSRAAVLAGGDSGPAVVTGKPDESLLIDAIHYEFEPRMPPKGKLSELEIAALTRWVELGLPWPDSPTELAGRPAESNPSVEVMRSSHWAFQPVRATVPPEPNDREWARTPIDQFVLSRLETEGLSPSPPADRRTLIRRLSFDLTGLPPSPEEVAAFLDDPASDAYEQLVDRLLASPHYGEQWGRHWLDVARYSDTKGYVYAREEASWVHAWAYRDWLVRSLNQDLPYDKFLLLQLAADQLADDPSELPAMGFLTLGRRFLGVTHDIIDDRIDVVTRGALGLTVACARCHDHKFDPIPTSDYYSLYGVFRNCVERLVPAVADTDTSGTESAFVVGLRERQAELNRRMSEERAAAAGRVRARVADYLLAQLELEKYPEQGFDQILSPNDLIPEFVRRWRDALARAGDHGDPIFRAWNNFMGLRAADFTDRAADVSHALMTSLPAGTINPLVARAFAEPPESPRAVAERYGKLFQDVIERWERLLDEGRRDGSPIPKGLPDPDAEALRRVLYGPDSPCEVPDEPIVNVEAFFPTATTEALWRLQGEVDRWLIRSSEAPPYAAILVDRSSTLEPQIFRRGNPATPGEEVARRFLQVIAGPNPTPFRDGSGRLEMARGIIDPKNPLTARVAVNRVWMHHFGAGLVRTLGDFGTRAEAPSHPELLDWLAARFVAEGWSLKRLHRQILLSSTYRQTSTGPSEASVRERALRLDPENRLLWRMPAHRLSFEELRDALLAVTGELNVKLGGKPQELLQAPFPTRRTLYGLVDRQDLPSVLRAFDFANPDLLIPQRNETTVPQQALFFMNHPFLLERSRALASSEEIANAATPEQKVRSLYQRVFQREPTLQQLVAALQLVEAAAAEPVVEPPPTSRDWRYGFGRYDADSCQIQNFQPLPHFNGEAWQGGPSWPDPALGWVQLTSEGGHPGNDLDHAAVRRWVAPRDGAIRIRSTLVHEVAQGDGVRGFLYSSRHGLIHKAEVHNATAGFDAGGLEVRAGDTIDFVVDIRDNLNSDQFLWVPVISQDGPKGTTSWDARADFQGGPPLRLDPWAQLTQVLLMANEFSYID